MWLSKYVTDSSHLSEESASGEIRAASGGNVAIGSTRDHPSAPVIAPWGVAYVPTAGSKTVVLPTSGGTVCLGVVSGCAEDLEPGELMLYSAGGASVVLKNDGRVLINGKAVT